MKESEELKASRAAYLEKLKKYGAVSMPETAHYTAGYKDGSAILQDVANLCEESERQLIEVTRQRDELLVALEQIVVEVHETPPTVSDRGLDRVEEIALEAIAGVKVDQFPDATKMIGAPATTSYPHGSLGEAVDSEGGEP